jgi:hypothetical protein
MRVRVELRVNAKFNRAERSAVADHAPLACSGRARLTSELRKMLSIMSSYCIVLCAGRIGKFRIISMRKKLFYDAGILYGAASYTNESMPIEARPTQGGGGPHLPTPTPPVSFLL